MVATTLAVATTATAVGMAMLLCIVLNRPCMLKREEEGDEKGFSAAGGGSREKMSREAEMERRLSWRPAEPPSTWQEALATVAETIRFTYSETLGRWPIGDLAFGIKLHMRKQGLQVASVFGGSNYIKVEGPELMDELIFLSRLLDICIVFSKKPFSVFLKCSDYCPEDILFRKHKAGLLKPAFTILRDKSSKCILLIVRGLHSIKDTLTAAIGLVVPFHHSLLDECGVTKVVLGYAHYGMVSAAHWIAKCATPCILKAIGQYPAYKIKIVGNSLGAGIAAILTYILREHTELSSVTCIAFAPAACMTWDLAESGQNFVTTIINGSDMVPTFSLVSADNLRFEVAASSWLSDLCDQFHQPFTSCTRAISTKSQNVLRNAQQAALKFARCMDCLGILSCHEEKAEHQSRIFPLKDMDSSWIKQHLDEIFAEQIDHAASCSNQYFNETMEEASMQRGEIIGPATKEETIERELWLELRKEHHTGSCTNQYCNGTMEGTSMQRDEIIGPASEEETTERELWLELGKGHHAGSCSNQYCNGTVEEALMQRDKTIGTATEEEIIERELWLELGKELQRQEEADLQTQEEDDVGALEDMMDEERSVCGSIGSKQPISAEEIHFFPPGRIRHIVAEQVPDVNSGGSVADELNVNMYETPRHLYGKIRLSPNMIKDHYMPVYKKMIELMIENLKRKEGS